MEAKGVLDQRIRVGGIPVHSLPHGDVLAGMEANIRGSHVPLHICITNTESMFHARRLGPHREFIEEATYSLCDGMGVVIGAKLQGQSVARFNGPVLLQECCEYGIARGWRHYFYGGKPGVAELLSNKLQTRFPGLLVVGTHCPPFRALTAEEEVMVVEHIRAAAPDIVWVGLGLLKQEAWAARFKTRIQAPWIVGVGAAFDFHAGTARWAPRFVRRMGFEWLYRLCFEPRMLKRNLWSFAFLGQVALETCYLSLASKWRCITGRRST